MNLVYKVLDCSCNWYRVVGTRGQMRSYCHLYCWKWFHCFLIPPIERFTLKTTDLDPPLLISFRRPCKKQKKQYHLSFGQAHMTCGHQKIRWICVSCFFKVNLQTLGFFCYILFEKLWFDSNDIVIWRSIYSLWFLRMYWEERCCKFFLNASIKSNHSGLKQILEHCWWPRFN